MSKNIMPASSPRQLKDRIKNLARENNLPANAVLQNFMMERFLERIAVSRYKNNLILKGGFLIAAMVGIDLRSTMDMDTTIKGIAVNENEIKMIMQSCSYLRRRYHNRSDQSDDLCRLFETISPNLQRLENHLI